MAIGIASFETLFKTYFPSTDLPYLIPDSFPLLNMLSMDGDLSGDVIDHPFLYGAAQGFSIDFNAAQQQGGNAPRAVRAALRCSQAYSMCEFYDKDLALSQGEAAYADLFQKTMVGKYQDFYKNLDSECHNSGNGWRGTIIAGPGQANPVNGAILAFNQVAVQTGLAIEAVFDQDQSVQAATYAGFPLAGSPYPPGDGRAPTTISSSVQVLAVDADARTLTLTDPSAFVAGSFIVQAGGAVGFSSANLNGGLIGLDAWNPYGGVTSTDQFCSINRSVYKTRLAGYSYDGTKLSMEDAIKRLSSRMSLGGARGARVCLMHPLDVDALDSKLGSFVRYSNFQTATVGFDSIVINGGAGRMDIVGDPHQVQGFARLITPEAIVFRHKNEVPHVVDVANRNVEQGANFDGRTARMRMYGQMCVMEPHKLGVVKLPQVLV
jgi:hypothetical protein